MTTTDDSRFDDTVAELYERRLVPLIFDAYALDMAERVAALQPASILEIAAGTGVVTRALDARVDATITASDLNPAMVDTARRHHPARRVTWCVADASDLPVADGVVDVAVCQFGVMFFPDRVRAYAEIRRVLRPDGTFVFTVWDEIAANDFAAAVTDAAAEVYPDDPPRFMARTPHGHHDEAVIRRDLRAAGFAAPTVERVERRSRAATPEDVARAFCLGTPLRNELDARGPDRLAEVTDHVASRLRSRFGAVDLEGAMAAFVITAAGSTAE